MITPREQEILQMLSEGKSKKAIAEELYIAETTVVSHVQNMMKKLKAKNACELIYLCMKMRLLS